MAKPKTKKAADEKQVELTVLAPPVFDKLLAFDKIEEALLRKITDEIVQIPPHMAAETMSKIALAHERMINIQRMHRENMESVAGTSRRIIFDFSIAPTREPGEPNGDK